ncbi:MAG: iron-sulfur cluster assembly scaffold protein [Sphingobium sp.]
MAEALYTIDILRLAASTSRWPALADPHGSAERRSPTCGSRVRIDVARDAGGRVAALGVDVSACALGQASAAILAAQAVGRDGEELHAAHAALAAYLGGASEALPDWPGIHHLGPARGYPARHASILLAFEAAAAALDAAAAQGDARNHAHG